MGRKSEKMRATIVCVLAFMLTYCYADVTNNEEMKDQAATRLAAAQAKLFHKKNQAQVKANHVAQESIINKTSSSTSKTISQKEPSPSEGQPRSTGVNHHIENCQMRSGYRLSRCTTMCQLRTKIICFVQKFPCLS